MKSDKYCLFCIKIRKSLKKFTTILSRHYNYGRNMIVIRDPKTFCFDFDLPNDVNDNLKHEIEFIIKSNGSLAENKIKNKIEWLLLKYKHGNNIHEHRKLWNKWVT